MGDTIKLGIILLIITSIAAVILGFSNSITADKIVEAEAMVSEEARREVITADKFEKADIQLDDERILDVYKGLSDSGEIMGYAITTATSGYGGNVEIITGISVEGKITGIKVVKHQETPGLGANAQNQEFRDRFKDKSTEKELVIVKSAPNNPDEVQAITGATITSNAVKSGVNLAIELFNTKLAK